jgi:hypothetical protein
MLICAPSAVVAAQRRVVAEADIMSAIPSPTPEVLSVRLDRARVVNRTTFK